MYIVRLCSNSTYSVVRDFKEVASNSPDPVYATMVTYYYISISSYGQLDRRCPLDARKALPPKLGKNVGACNRFMLECGVASPALYARGAHAARRVFTLLLQWFHPSSSVLVGCSNKRFRQTTSDPLYLNTLSR